MHLQKSIPFCKSDPKKAVIAISHSRKKVDLTGQRFGKLTVIAPTDNVDGRTAWLCHCDCGNDIIVKTYHLRDGHTQSCGCLKENGFALTYVDGTCLELIKTKTIRKNNTSGVPGVDWLTAHKRWRASICFQGKRYYLGRYKNFEDAVAARKAAETRLHDEFLKKLSKEENAENIANTQ